ncbi:MAG: hypothetical protein KF764_05705 [Labilithrix sp.]|nr:hypothetical protein [Labilithrix sp.]
MNQRTSNREERARSVAIELLRAATPETALDPSDRALRPSPSQQEGLDYRRASLFLRWFDGVLRVHKATAHALADESLAHVPGSDDDLSAALMTFHRMLMAHPVAVKSLCAALRREGRRYGRTEEGAALRDRLQRSAEIRRATILWRTVSLDMFEKEDEGDDGDLPSTYLDHLVSVTGLSNPASILGGLFVDEGRPRS